MRVEKEFKTGNREFDDLMGLLELCEKYMYPEKKYIYEDIESEEEKNEKRKKEDLEAISKLIDLCF